MGALTFGWLGEVTSIYQRFAATRRFRDYQPQRVTMKSVQNWLAQYDQKDRYLLLALLDHVIYYSEKETERILVSLNNDLLQRLGDAQVSPKNVIYVQIHDAASSSPRMLSMLRDRGHLEHLGCHFVDWKDVQGLHDLTVRLRKGAVIYVDDFAASGDQFQSVRQHLYENIPGAFSEFFLLPCICIEAHEEISKTGVDVVTNHIHCHDERPLHPASTLLDVTAKVRLVELCEELDSNYPLGYRRLATMVVYFRNAPNTIPLVLRGSRKYRRLGIFPRTKDLPWP